MIKKLLILLLIFLLGYIIFYKKKEHITTNCNIDGLQPLCPTNDEDAKKIESLIRYNNLHNMDELKQCMKENKISPEIIYKFENDHLLDYYSLKNNFDCNLLEKIITNIKK
jgi:hypothetical protein